MFRKIETIIYVGIVLFVLLTTALAAEQGVSPSNSRIQSADPHDAMTGMEFVLVPSGCFSMGSTKGNEDEQPVHDACVSSFFLGKYEVTQGQWAKIMGDNPSRFKTCGENCPVEQVSWNDAQEFIRRLNGLTGKNYRLPTETEWEYACTSGGKAETFCGGDDIGEVAWFLGKGGGKTHPVGQKKPNGLGLYDMSGNVWEWVHDRKGDYVLSGQQQTDRGAFSATRVRRGGSWQYYQGQSRAAWRSSGYPDDRAIDVGFRLALSVTQ